RLCENGVLRGAGSWAKRGGEVWLAKWVRMERTVRPPSSPGSSAALRGWRLGAERGVAIEGKLSDRSGRTKYRQDSGRGSSGIYSGPGPGVCTGVPQHERDEHKL